MSTIHDLVFDETDTRPDRDLRCRVLRKGAVMGSRCRCKLHESREPRSLLQTSQRCGRARVDLR